MPAATDMSDSLVIYVGDSTFQERSDPVFSTNGYELDSAAWPWQGATPLKKAFEDGLAKFQPMGTTFPRMFLNSTSDDGGNNVTTETLNYIGFRTVAPPPKAESSLVTASGTLPIGSTNFSFQYYAPRTKWTWFQAGVPNPTTPTYATTVGGISPAAAMYNIRLANGSPLSFAAAFAVAKTVPTQTIISDYQYSPTVPGAIWQCSCTVDLNFIPIT